MTFEEFRDGDKAYRALVKSSALACERVAGAPVGSTRARNARIAWSRAAEARDERERYLRRMYDARFPAAAVAS